MMADDGRLALAKGMPIDEIADRLGIAGLKRAGREMTGPCPVCGGRDRFSINLDRQVFNCRHCGGGDGIKMAELVLSVDFKDALSWLVGDADARIDTAEARRRAEKAERDRQAREAHAAKERDKAIAAARAIWTEGKPAARSPVADYLAARGMPAWLHDAPPHCLRYHPALRYAVPSTSGRGWDIIYTGPAMLAAVQAPDGSLLGVHRTWIDPSRPKGKALITGPDGAPLQVKKILGSKKGAAIRLVRDLHPFDVLIMGEGIETTLSAYAASSHVPNAAYWAGVDLGNMSGQRITTGKGMMYRGIPRLDDTDAFVAPPWIRRLIFIQDGDSDPKLTRAKLMSGLRRSKHYNPTLRIQIAHAGDGMDLNDVLMDAGNPNE